MITMADLSVVRWVAQRWETVCHYCQWEVHGSQVERLDNDNHTGASSMMFAEYKELIAGENSNQQLAHWVEDAMSQEFQ